jgi:large subunit ribosomal protein L30
LSAALSPRETAPHKVSLQHIIYYCGETKGTVIKMADLRIKLVKSLNGRLKKHIATAKSLGLVKIGGQTVQPNNPQTLGKISQIRYLISVTEE